MPHVIVKLYPGKSEHQKATVAADAVMSSLNYGKESVSVGIEDVEPKDRANKVFRPDIVGKPETIYKKPGYNPL